MNVYVSNHNHPELLRNALSFVPANLPRDEWARVGMAIKSEYPDDTGLQLFSDWSAAALAAALIPMPWAALGAASRPVVVWACLPCSLAKQHGFKLPRQGQDSKPVSAAERQRQDDERRQRQQAEDAAIQATQEAAAGEAVALGQRQRNRFQRLPGA